MGFYLAVIAVIAGGLLRGHSLLVLGVLAGVCALSFYVWAHARRALTGREELVLLEHVWFALLVSGATLRVLDQPVLPYLDVIAVGIAFFLAAGRIGCLLVGCCHGKPASAGIAYGPDHVRDGFPHHWMGVRLFPVQVLESIGLCGIGGAGLLVLPWAPAGSVLSWFLGAYSVMRFGLEGLRGDRRPHFFGLSVGRWMAMAELVIAMVAVQDELSAHWLKASSTALVVLALLFVLVFLGHWGRGPSRRLLRQKHVATLRSLVLEAGSRSDCDPVPARTPAGVTIAVSPSGAGASLVSLRLPEGAHDLPLLCELAARALPELELETAHVTPDGALLLFRVRAQREGEGGSTVADTAALGDALYGRLVRQLQASLRSPPSGPRRKIRIHSTRPETAR